MADAPHVDLETVGGAIEPKGQVWARGDVTEALYKQAQEGADGRRCASCPFRATVGRDLALLRREGEREKPG
jgi:hypothetical protein